MNVVEEAVEIDEVIIEEGDEDEPPVTEEEVETAVEDLENELEVEEELQEQLDEIDPGLTTGDLETLEARLVAE